MLELIRQKQEMTAQKRPLLMSEPLIVFLLLFCYLPKQGNYNLLYFYGLLVLIYSLLKDISIVKRAVLWVVPLFFFTLLSFLFSSFQFSFGKSIISITKIFLCLLIMFFISSNAKFLNLKKFAYLLSFALSLSLILAILLPHSFLWVQFDEVNLYNQHRLQLFFMEPSQLGFLLGLFLLFATYCFIFVKKSRISIFIILLMLTLFYLAMPLGGILCFLLALFFLLINAMFYKKEFVSKKRKIAFSLILVLIAVAVVIMITPNSISSRLFDIKSGNDGSFNGRIVVSLNTLPTLLRKTFYFGVGLGNINTDSVLAITNHIYANSFFAIVAETGVLGLVYLLMFFGHMFKSIKYNRILKLSIFAYLFLYQIQGGYFTDPSIWLFYGFIFSSTRFFAFSKANKNNNFSRNYSSCQNINNNSYISNKMEGRY